MKVQSKRLFISDLPEEISEDDLSKNFKGFGNVTSIEIKERKDLSSKHQFSHFAFINIDVDDRTLQTCFQKFSEKKWKGHYLNIQLAKESFLDRLKREREEANKTSPTVTSTNSEPIKKQEVKLNGKQNTTKFTIGKKSTTADSSSDSSESEDEPSPKTKPELKTRNNVEKSTDVGTTETVTENGDDFEDVYSNIVVKNNKNRIYNAKIESVGNEPIIKIELNKKKSMDPKRKEADQKRIDSIARMKQGYQQQKNAIKAALSKIDVQTKSTTVFNNDGENQNLKGNRKGNVNNRDSGLKPLFDDENENSEMADEYNFAVKKQYEGKKGQKLLELQSKFKNDSRFQMDERFYEEAGDEAGHEEDEQVQGFEEQETTKQLEILEQVLGRKVTSRGANADRKTKAMLRFDPEHPEHSKYETKVEPRTAEKKKRKRKDLAQNEDSQEQIPEVSKETFYEVKDSFKETMQEKESFSLLSTFGRKDVEEYKENDDDDVEETSMPKKSKKHTDTQNPFRYESSSEDEDGKNEMKEDKKEIPKTEERTINLGPTKLWAESFFFKKDDYRLQEGIDFVKRLEAEDNSEFTKVRRNLKEIVRAKVRHNLRKGRPFKKKLGGSSKKKMIRVRKALKR